MVLNSVPIKFLIKFLLKVPAAGCIMLSSEQGFGVSVMLRYHAPFCSHGGCWELALAHIPADGRLPLQPTNLRIFWRCSDSCGLPERLILGPCWDSSCEAPRLTWIAPSRAVWTSMKIVLASYMFAMFGFSFQQVKWSIKCANFRQKWRFWKSF